MHDNLISSWMQIKFKSHAHVSIYYQDEFFDQVVKKLHSSYIQVESKFQIFEHWFDRLNLIEWMLVLIYLQFNWHRSLKLKKNPKLRLHIKRKIISEGFMLEAKILEGVLGHFHKDKMMLLANLHARDDPMD